MAAQPTPAPRAILLDALGTLLRFQPPAPRLREALQTRLGVDVGARAAEAAMRAEIAFYRAHLHEGSDEAGLAHLRARSAEEMRPALGPAAASADGALLTAALMDALHFEPYPEVPDVLRALRRRGIRLVVVSNWDASLHERLQETGLAPLVDGALASAQEGVAKPDRELFARALDRADARPEDAWHAGDSVDADVLGALRAGVRPVLVARGEVPPDVPPGVPVVRSLDELPGLLGRARTLGSEPMTRVQPPPERPELPEGVAPRAPLPPPAGAARRPPAVWLPFAVLLAVFFVSQLFAVALFAVVSSADRGISASDPPDGFTIAATFLLEATLVAGACAGLAASQGRVRPSDFGLRRVDPRRALRVAAAVYAAFWVTAGVLLAIFGEPAEQEIVERLRGQDALAALAGFALLTCVLAPLAEEFFFRGFMFTVLARRLGPVPGALVVGAAFGLIHAPAPWLSLVVLGCFGVALCTLYWRTQSIIPCMGLHALHNSISFAATKALPWWGFLALIGASVALVLAVAAAISSRPSPLPAA